MHACLCVCMNDSVRSCRTLHYPVQFCKILYVSEQCVWFCTVLRDSVGSCAVLYDFVCFCLVHGVCLCPSVSLSVCLSACTHALSRRINVNQLFCRVLLHMAAFFASNPLESYGCMFVYEPMTLEALDLQMPCAAK